MARRRRGRSQACGEMRGGGKEGMMSGDASSTARLGVQQQADKTAEVADDTSSTDEQGGGYGGAG